MRFISFRPHLRGDAHGAQGVPRERDPRRRDRCLGQGLRVGGPSMELGSVTLKRIGFFCFPIKHSTRERARMHDDKPFKNNMFQLYVSQHACMYPNTHTCTHTNTHTHPRIKTRAHTHKHTHTYTHTLKHAHAHTHTWPLLTFFRKFSLVCLMARAGIPS